jgi:hypothetical protein
MIKSLRLTTAFALSLCVSTHAAWQDESEVSPEPKRMMNKQSVAQGEELQEDFNLEAQSPQEPWRLSLASINMDFDTNRDDMAMQQIELYAPISENFKLSLGYYESQWDTDFEGYFGAFTYKITDRLGIQADYFAANDDNLPKDQFGIGSFIEMENNIRLLAMYRHRRYKDNQTLRGVDLELVKVWAGSELIHSVQATVSIHESIPGNDIGHMLNLRGTVYSPQNWSLGIEAFSGRSRFVPATNQLAQVDLNIWGGAMRVGYFLTDTFEVTGLINYMDAEDFEVTTMGIQTNFYF